MLYNLTVEELKKIIAEENDLFQRAQSAGESADSLTIIKDMIIRCGKIVEMKLRGFFSVDMK